MTETNLIGSIVLGSMLVVAMYRMAQYDPYEKQGRHLVNKVLAVIFACIAVASLFVSQVDSEGGKAVVFFSYLALATYLFFYQNSLVFPSSRVILKLLFGLWLYVDYILVVVYVDKFNFSTLGIILTYVASCAYVYWETQMPHQQHDNLK